MRKFTSPNHRSVPDRLFITARGYVFFIEFKAPGKLPTPAQEREIERLKDHGQTVYVCDNENSGKDIVTKEVAKL